MVLVWVLAALFISNVVLVATFAVMVEARRRRDQRELRALEVIWESPPRSAGATREQAGSVRVLGKHDVVVVPEPGRHRMVRTASLVLALASVVAVAAVAFVDSADPRVVPTFADPLFTDRSDPGSRERAGGSDGEPEPVARSVATEDRRGQEGGTEDTVGSESPPEADAAVPGDDAYVPAVVVAAAFSATAIQLDWAKVPGATAYRVERRADDDEIWLRIALRSAGVSTYTDTGLVSGTTYYYRVTAQLEDRWAPASDVVSATTVEGPPATPTLLAKARRTGIILAWTDVADETGYRVERMAEGDHSWIAIATTGEGIVEYKDGMLLPGGSYEYRVIAVGPGGESTPSNVVKISLSVTITEGPPGQSGDDQPGNKPTKEQAVAEETDDIP